MWEWIICGVLAIIKDTERRKNDYRAVSKRLSVSTFAFQDLVLTKLIQ